MSMPMLRAVPAMIRKPAASSPALRSLSLILTMSSTCLRVTLPTFSLFGVLAPAATPAAFLSNTAAGGDLQFDDADDFFCHKESLRFFDLPILQFHRGIPAEDVYRDLQLAALRLNFLDHTAEIKERPVVNLDGFPDLEVDLGPFGFFRLGNLGLDHRDLIRGHRHGPFAADKTDDAGGIADEVPRFFEHAPILINQAQVDVNVAGMELAHGHGFFAAAHFGDPFHGDQDFLDVFAHFLGLQTFFDVFFDLLFLAGQGMDDEPLALHEKKGSRLNLGHGPHQEQDHHVDPHGEAAQQRD